MHLLPAKLNTLPLHLQTQQQQNMLNGESGGGNHFSMDMHEAVMNTVAHTPHVLNSYLDNQPMTFYASHPADYAKLVDVCQMHHLQMDVSEKEVVPWFVYSLHNKDRVVKLECPMAVKSFAQASTDLSS
jgi:hypothetical protein